MFEQESRELERFRRRRAAEILRHALEHDPTLEEVLSVRVLAADRTSEIALAPNILHALWRMDRWCRPVQSPDQTRWFPSPLESH